MKSVANSEGCKASKFSYSPKGGDCNLYQEINEQLKLRTTLKLIKTLTIAVRYVQKFCQGKQKRKINYFLLLDFVYSQLGASKLCLDPSHVEPCFWMWPEMPDVVNWD